MEQFFIGFSDELEKLGKANTYPFSRFATSSYNPLALFGVSRFVGSRGLMGRLAKGRVMEQDRNSIAKILEGKGMSGAKAMEKAEKIIADSKAGKFKGRKKYPISRFITSRAVGGTVGGASEATKGALIGSAAGPAGAAAGAIAGAAQGAYGGAMGTQISRWFGPRGLAGRIAKGKKLTKNEKRLMLMINSKPKLRERLKKAVEALKGE